MTDNPITLADVRTHIERRIQECQREQARYACEGDKWWQVELVRRELTEVLALLKRVQQSTDTKQDGPCPECGGKRYVYAPGDDAWACGLCNPEGVAKEGGAR